MIVVDTNQIVYLLIGGDATDTVRRVFMRDSAWSAPLLWRSEFRSVISQYLRRNELNISQALQIQKMAEELLAGREHIPDSGHILRLVERSGCSAYDCEFVALALDLRVPLLTSDKRILRDFPETAVSPEAYIQNST